MAFRAAVVGHSFVPRFQTYLKEAGYTHALNFDQAEVRYFGSGGLRVKDLPGFAGQLATFRPDIVVLMVGCNDITADTDPEELALCILTMASQMQRNCQCRALVVCQLFPRFWAPHHKYFCAGYNGKAELVTAILQRETSQMQGVHFWQHSFLTFPDASDQGIVKMKEFFLPDGVHLAPKGNYRLYRSLRQLMLQHRW